MPTDTFFNLGEDKRERVIKAAIDEFAKYPYHKSSINRIVKKADIAKGSFYQYFADKSDIFKYIIDLLMEKEFAYSEEIMNNFKALNFFDTLKIICIKLIDYYKENLKLVDVWVNFLKMDDNDFKGKILQGIIEQSDSFFKELLFEGVQRGEIDNKIDLDLTAHLLTGLIMGMLDKVSNNYKEEGDIEKFFDKIDEILEIIENGIKN
ncbi:TetR family transcriptional regulator [Orenia metallireducens]|uniref:Transcriptional regulator, TetR family n=1 Tax=Orenia metallireducens TaxID=1413210 RepID=A0A285F2F1_9FIRM|nr:TetR/AcrR family transcriptional regulator [Orenia metallireducens]PRX34753.1 TetR family transcriptional regulator [Orenia metallireducens]SNY05490.1 transcriptional regulator, TetR family [Orenia metallireducens]